MTKAQRRELECIGKRGLHFYDDHGRDAFITRHLGALSEAGLITIERKSGPFGAFGRWAHITDKGREELRG